MAKTIKEINEKIKKGEAVVVTAEEIIDIVEKKRSEEGSPAGRCGYDGNLWSDVFIWCLH